MLDALKPWRALKDQDGRTLPRRAGVSSFGFGGTNAHILLEEPPEIPSLRRGRTSFSAYLICLSAKTGEALKEKQRELALWLQGDGREANLLDVSATLLVAKEHFNTKAAFVVSGTEELIAKLEQNLSGKTPEGFFVGQEPVSQQPDNDAPLKLAAALADKKGSSTAYRNRLIALAKRYINGERWDTTGLGERIPYQRLTLPAYPFAKERYWLPELESAPAVAQDLSASQFHNLHPLLHRNTSSLQEHRYSTAWTGRESSILSGIEKPGTALPSLLLLEMARAALSLSDGTGSGIGSAIRLQEIVWPQPMAAPVEGQEVHTALIPFGDETVGFEIYRDAQGDQPGVIYCQGHARRLVEGAAGIASLTLPGLDRNWTAEVSPGHLPYIKESYRYNKQFLVRLHVADNSVQTDAMFLHPGMLDAVIGAAWTAVGVNLEAANTVLVAVGELGIYGACSSEMWVLIHADHSKDSGILHVNMMLYDSEGSCRLAIRGMELERNGAESIPDEEIKDTERQWFSVQKSWTPQPLIPGELAEGAIAVLADSDTESLALSLQKTLNAHSVELIRADASADQYGGQDWSRYSAWIDLTGCGNQMEPSWDWITVLQQAVENSRQNGIRLLGITRGLESLQNESIHRAGAARAGLYRMLQSEYRHLISRHIDVEASATAESIAAVIAGELASHGEDSEICYRHGTRYKAVLNAMELPEGKLEQSSKLRFSEQEVLWITGGTRGLGYLCARHFVEHHGVKRLVLSGREELPPREHWNQQLPAGQRAKVEAILRLEALGVQVKVLSTPLSDREAMNRHVQTIRTDWGPIAGVIHCAGSWDLDYPAFIRKPLDVVKQVMEPKTEGFEVLFESVKAEPCVSLCCSHRYLPLFQPWVQGEAIMRWRTLIWITQRKPTGIRARSLVFSGRAGRKQDLAR